MTDVEETVLRIDPVESSPEGLRSLQSRADDANGRWYYRKRYTALRAFLAAGKFDPLQHPRGPDGRFIEKFGWVRWMVDGKWKRGLVSSIDGNGNVHVVESGSGEHHAFTNQMARKTLYAAPKTKAKLDLPDPTKSDPGKGFAKVGGQGGSNPGGLYETAAPEDVSITTTSTVKDGEESLKLLQGFYQKLKKRQFTVNADDLPEDLELKPENDMVGYGVLLDSVDNAVYIRTPGGHWRLAGDDKDIPPGEIFGAAYSTKRFDKIGKLEFADGLDAVGITSFEQTLASLSTQRPEQGTRFYVKKGKSETHARNEALANMLYEMGGVPVPNVSVGKDGVTIASEIVPGEDRVPLSQHLNDENMLSRIRQDFVFDAWLANWDVVGLGYDNIVIMDGVPFRIDAGGSLLYRAQGSPKGNKFGNEVGELESLTNGMNPQSAKVFGDISQSELKAGAERLAAISPQEIRDQVEAHGLDKSLSDTLIARRKFILDKYGIDEPLVVPGVKLTPTPSPVDEIDLLLSEEPVVEMTPGIGKASTPTYPSDLTGMHWNPSLKNFEPGTLSYEIPTEYFDWEDEYTKPFKPVDAFAQVMLAKEDGNQVWFSTDAGMARITDARYLNDKLEFDVHEPVSGQKWTQSFHPASTTYMHVANIPPADVDGFELEQREHVSTYRAYIADVNSNRPQASVFADSLLTGNNPIASRYVVPASLNKGDWFSVDDEKKFYRLVGIDTSKGPGNHEVLATDMNGDQVLFKSSDIAFTTRAADHSFLNDALDAMEARAQVANKNDESSSVTVPGGVTKDDVALAHLNAQQPATSKDGLVNPEPPNVPQVPPGEAIETPGKQYQTEAPPQPSPFAGVVNSKLTVIGDQHQFPSGEKQDVLDLVGKKVYVELSGDYASDYKSKGIYTVTEVEEHPLGKFRPKLIDSSGNQLWSYQPINVYEISGDVPPVTAYQLKNDYTISSNGVKVGTWTKDYWGYKATLDGKYTVSGKPHAIKSQKKFQLKNALLPMILPPGVVGAKPKSEPAKELEKKIRSNVKFDEPNKLGPGGASVTLMDGSVVMKDMWVISKTDGSIGQIVADHINGYDGYVTVKMADGKTKGRAASTLAATAGPDGAPPLSPLYASVKLKDGSQPFPGQSVSLISDGADGSTIIQITPDGSVRVSWADGKKTWVSAKLLTPTTPAQKPEDLLTPASGASIATAPKVSKPAKPQKIPYAAPDGSTINQGPNAVANYQKYAPDRKLTKDGFVPMIGMKVRDKDGKLLVITRVAKSSASNPSSVYVIDPSTPGYGQKVKQASTLWVDHAAELSTSSGKPIPVVNGVKLNGGTKEIHAPDGSVIYSYNENMYSGGRYVPIKKYIAVTPNGKAYKFQGNGNTYSFQEKYEWSTLIQPTTEKVAIVDSSSDSTMTMEVGDVSYKTVAWIHKTGKLDDVKTEKAKADAALAEKSKDANPLEPEKFTGSKTSLVQLTPPQDAAAPETNLPQPPQAVSDPSKLKGKAAVAGSHTVESAVSKLQEQIKAGGPGNKSVYAMGDADVIEDMAIRLQSVVDQDGNKMVELRFNLLEGAVDDLSDKLITTQSAKTGAWKSSTLATPQMLEGTYISVRVSSANTLKPSQQDYPNAMVIDTPEKIGVGKSGFDLYRVTVRLNDGTVGTMDVEARPTPSVQTYEWDPNKVQYSSYWQGGLNPDAASMGWSVRTADTTGYETIGSSKDQIDADGRKHVDLDGKHQSTIVSAAGAYRLRYDGGDGAQLSVQVANTSAIDRPSIVSGENARRANSNGEVLIRVREDDPEMLEKISRMMSAVGVSPDKQGQPTPEQLRVMALNKVDKQFSPTYKHMGTPNVTGQIDDAGVAGVLANVDKFTGGRKTQLSDIHLRSGPDGRVAVVLSDELVDALAKTVKWDYGYHGSSSGGFRAELFTSPTATGLMSSDERWSAGIRTSGMSSSTDLSYDSGNRVYFRFMDPGYGTAKIQAGNGSVVIGKKAVLKSLDWYSNSGDHFGRRSGTNAQAYTKGQFNSSNEFMMKRKIDVEQIGYIFVDKYDYDKTIAGLKAKGITHINGRPIEDVVVPTGSKTVDDLNKLNVNYGTEIAITDLGAPV